MRKKYILLGVLLLCASVAFATPLQSVFYQKLLGLNSRINPKLLDDSESPDMSNFALTETGAIKERPVFSKYNSSSGELGSNAISGLWKFYTTTDKYFVATAGSNVASGTGGAFSTDIGVTASSVSPETFWDAVTFNNHLYAFNSSVPMQKWSGTGAFNAPASTPATNCRYGEVHKNRIWAANSNTYPYRIYFSSLSTDNWTATGGSVDLPDLTQTITGLVSYGGFLYIFTETDIYILRGSTPNNFSLIKSNSDVGAIAPRSIQVTDIGIIFLARTGVFRFNGTKSFKLSDKVEPLINLISKSYIKNAAGLWDGQSRYWLAYTDRTASANNKVLLYDTLLKEWYPYDNLSINYFVRAFGGTDKGELYGGSSLNNGIVWLLQDASGTETVVHDTQSEFNDGTTFNTVAWGTASSPIQRLSQYEYKDNNETELLAHLNDADAATTSEDVSYQNHTLSFQDNVQIDTAEKKLGTSSLMLDGSGDFIQIADDTSWDIAGSATDDWTIDFWVKHDDHVGEEPYVSQVESATNYYRLYHVHGSGIRFHVSSGGSNVIDIGTAGEITDTDWHHIALCKVGSEWGIYKDGTQISHTSDSDTATFAGTFRIGLDQESQYFDGHIDEVRVQKSNAFGAVPVSALTDTIQIGTNKISNGTLTSEPLNINASAAAALGTIEWDESLSVNNDIQISTRTGATSDTVYFNGWEEWVSRSTVVCNVTFNTSNYGSWDTSDSANFLISNASSQGRNVTLYEKDDNLDPEAIGIAVTGALSTDDYTERLFQAKDISGYKWVGFWLKSPQTGNSVKLGLGESTPTTTTFITANTIVVNTWEYHYMPIDMVTDTDIDAVTYIRLTYLGDTSGTIYLGDVYAYDFFDNEETITSGVDDYIQYMVIMGTDTDTDSPELTNVTLEYTPASGDPEATLETYYKTKPYDMGSPMKDKHFLDFFVELETDTSPTTIEVDWNINDGEKSGSFSKTDLVTGRTIRIERHFPAQTFGKTIQFNYQNDDTDSNVTIRGAEVRFRAEEIN